LQLKYWKIGLFEMARSFSKRKFTESLKELVPGIKKEFLIEGKTGIRAQIITRNGELYDDFLLDKNERILNVINAPSPAATSSFAIAREIINQLEKMKKPKEIKIALVGLGYVGLPLAVEFSKHYNVIGFDINSKRIEELINFNDNTKEVSKGDLKYVMSKEK
jgi:hypothetical protein